MTSRVVALFYTPWPSKDLTRPSRSDLVGLYRYAVWYKANPRGADYMRSLLSQRFPDAEWINVGGETGWPNVVGQADKVLLLYPDAIGLGFASVERTLLAHKRVKSEVVVLNGRGRYFSLNREGLRGLRLRRFLEWTMLPELLFLPVFLLVTPLLWVADRVRGRA